MSLQETELYGVEALPAILTLDFLLLSRIGFKTSQRLLRAMLTSCTSSISAVIAAVEDHNMIN